VSLTDQPDASTFSQVKSSYCLRKRMRIREMQTVLLQALLAGMTPGVKRGMDWGLQDTQTENADENMTLALGQMKSLQQRDRQQQDQEVGEDVTRRVDLPEGCDTWS
jgi:hypothetical protein